MSAKDNFAQAMKELLNSGEAGSTDSTEGGQAPGSFSSFSTPDSRPPKAPAPEKQESVFGGSSFSKPATTTSTDSSAEEPKEEEVESDVSSSEPEVVEVEPQAASEPSINMEAPAIVDDTSGQSSDAMTVIAPGTTIVGNINTNGNLTMNGDVKGDVKVAKKFILEGRVIGDIDAQELEVKRSSIKGNITVAGNLNMDDHSVVVGDISAKNTTTDGKIKGNLTVLERGHLKPSATLVGNLVAGTVIIDEGAMLKGDIAITNAQNDNIIVDEPEFDIQI